jgi:2,5-diketo-D-gluconate reductase B
MNDRIIYGTYPLQGAALRHAIHHAVDAGYRAFDTAQIYGNEADLGQALRETGMPREQFRVTTKIAPPYYSEQSFLPSLQRSLDSMQLDYMDTLLAHFPVPNHQMATLVHLLASAHEAGLARNIGISNFTPAQMRLAAAVSPQPLAVNQIEFHPLLDGQALCYASAETGIPLQAFSPLARGAVLHRGAPILEKIAAAHGRTAAQVVVRWILQQGVGVVTQSSRPEHIAMNFAGSDFALTADEMERIGQLANHNVRIINNHSIPWAPAWA